MQHESCVFPRSDLSNHIRQEKFNGTSDPSSIENNGVGISKPISSGEDDDEEVSDEDSGPAVVHNARDQIQI